MSLAVQPLIPITVHDPRVIQQERVFPVLKGAEDILYKQFSTNSISASSVHFVCPPPSQNVYVDRRIHLRLPVQISCTATSGLVNGSYLFNPSCMAIRSFPLQKAMESILMTLNDQSFSMQIGDIISAFEHFNIGQKLRQIDYSKCATYPCCQFQNFFDSYNETANSAGTATAMAAMPSAANAGVPVYYRQQKSEMCLWSESALGSCQKQMPFYVTNNQIAASNAIATASTIQFVSTEPLFISPLFYSDFEHDDSAFYGINSMSFTFNFVSNAGNRMLAIDGLAANLPSTDNEAGVRALSITSSVSFSPTLNSTLQNVGSYNAALLFQYLTPQLVDKGENLNRVLNYPYNSYERWPSSEQTLAADAQGTFTSTNVQLSSIPTKLLIFVRPNNAQLQKNPFVPDCFARCESLTVQWGNKSGLLSSASIQQLYDISVRAGCTLSYNDWACVPMPKAAISTSYGASHCYGTGSVIGIDPVDLGLSSIDAPGKLQNTTLYVSGNFRNVSGASQVMVMYVVAVSAGLVSLFNGRCSLLVGTLNSNNILNSHAQSAGKLISYSDVRRMYGGNFLSDIKPNLQNLLKRKKDKEASMGMGAGSSGVAGGVRVTRTNLRDRLQ